ncbi:peptidase M15B and M15C DD-carboxypeptidase family protein [Nitzschia inconspicua]|uniref:Peptidase M15B and M15C DD-carboxypeptidase family protein n=1 Tax=Nitzschia inconspicua TaxID=303405 RepID=A0A9K3PAS4_9STRA|nr:peptidase M15B and M15C DD-carboxypeptidase family protein [Nitzschia inconspicua]
MASDVTPVPLNNSECAAMQAVKLKSTCITTSAVTHPKELSHKVCYTSLDPLTGIKYDGRCEKCQGYVALLPSETSAPTSVTTFTPTDEVTDTSTQKPTDDPTGDPTGEPTDTSTQKPTDDPTGDPTEEPMDTSTQKPTDNPTGDPTEEPTDTSTQKPTENPTEEPTDTSTQKPTDNPTGSSCDCSDENSPVSYSWKCGKDLYYCASKITSICSQSMASDVTPVPLNDSECATMQAVKLKSTCITTSAVTHPKELSHKVCYTSLDPLTGIKYDGRCEKCQGYVALLPSETSAPTSVTTFTPTDEVTDTSTQKPTDDPTGDPTGEPTDTSSQKPTDDPTGDPTEEPTDTSTQKPTDNPTGDPTEEPTDTSTQKPTENPTEEPTDTSTQKPTENPTGSSCDCSDENSSVSYSWKCGKDLYYCASKITSICSQSMASDVTPVPLNDSECAAMQAVKLKSTCITTSAVTHPKELSHKVCYTSLDPLTGIKYDGRCEKCQGYVALLPSETSAPTSVTTFTPTDEVSDTSTQKPTDDPTGDPTGEPTDTSTQKPTDDPTGDPTEEPTDTSTQKPTDNPTEEPTDTSTQKPTENPTEEPTDTSTQKPTENPTGSSCDCSDENSPVSYSWKCGKDLYYCASKITSICSQSMASDVTPVPLNNSECAAMQAVKLKSTCITTSAVTHPKELSHKVCYTSLDPLTGIKYDGRCEKCQGYISVSKK